MVACLWTSVELVSLPASKLTLCCSAVHLCAAGKCTCRHSAVSWLLSNSIQAMVVCFNTNQLANICHIMPNRQCSNQRSSGLVTIQSPALGNHRKPNHLIRWPSILRSHPPTEQTLALHTGCTACTIWTPMDTGHLIEQ